MFVKKEGYKKKMSLLPYVTGKARWTIAILAVVNRVLAPRGGYACAEGKQ